MVSPGPSVRILRGRRRGKRKLPRPQDIREGVTNAYYIVKDVSICPKGEIIIIITEFRI